MKMRVRIQRFRKNPLRTRLDIVLLSLLLTAAVVCIAYFTLPLIHEFKVHKTLFAGVLWFIGIATFVGALKVSTDISKMPKYVC